MEYEPDFIPSVVAAAKQSVVDQVLAGAHLAQSLDTITFLRLALATGASFTLSIQATTGDVSPSCRLILVFGDMLLVRPAHAERDVFIRVAEIIAWSIVE